MIPHFDEAVMDALTKNPDQMLKRAETGDGPYPQAVAAIAYARAGFRVVPLRPGTKKLDQTTGFTHGRDALLPNYSEVVDLWYDDPTRNVGLAPDPHLLLVDADRKHGATLDSVRDIGLDVEGVNRERTPSGGWHLWYRLPRKFRAQKGATGRGLPKGVELLGPRSFGVAPHSQTLDGWYRHDSTGGRVLGKVPDDWPYLGHLLEPAFGVELSRISPSDWQEATSLRTWMRTVSEHHAGIAGLFRRSYAQTIRAIDPTLDASPSGRDFLLVYCASHFLRDHPRRAEVLFALLWQTRWPQQKSQRKPGTDPEEYAYDTIAAALSCRQHRDGLRLALLRDAIFAADSGNLRAVSSAPPHTPPLLDAALSPGEGKGMRVEASVLTLAGEVDADVFWDVDAVRGGEDVRELIGQGWRRIPVLDLAAVHGVHRETVRRALIELERRGILERKPLDYRHDGKPRRDSIVRLLEGAKS